MVVILEVTLHLVIALFVALNSITCGTVTTCPQICCPATWYHHKKIFHFCPYHTDSLSLSLSLSLTHTHTNMHTQERMHGHTHSHVCTHTCSGHFLSTTYLCICIHSKYHTTLKDGSYYAMTNYPQCVSVVL